VDLLGVFRVLFGFIYVLFIPGFLATLALFPKKGEIDDIERLALSLVLSLALSVIPVMFLNYLGVLVNEVNVFLIILCTISICGMSAFFRLKLSER
jgi:uncharacterized membrane protein